jgi:hypothetical protein
MEAAAAYILHSRKVPELPEVVQTRLRGGLCYELSTRSPLKVLAQQQERLYLGFALHHYFCKRRSMHGSGATQGGLREWLEH